MLQARDRSAEAQEQVKVELREVLTPYEQRRGLSDPARLSTVLGAALGRRVYR